MKLEFDARQDNPTISQRGKEDKERVLSTRWSRDDTVDDNIKQRQWQESKRGKQSQPFLTENNLTIRQCGRENKKRTLSTRRSRKDAVDKNIKQRQ